MNETAVNNNGVGLKMLIRKTKSFVGKTETRKRDKGCHDIVKERKEH